MGERRATTTRIYRLAARNLARLRVGALWAWRAGSDVMAHQEAALDLVDRADTAEILGVSGTPALHRLPRRT